jgi:hypothetical protein
MMMMWQSRTDTFRNQVKMDLTLELNFYHKVWWFDTFTKLRILGISQRTQYHGTKRKLKPQYKRPLGAQQHKNTHWRNTIPATGVHITHYKHSSFRSHFWLKPAVIFLEIYSLRSSTDEASHINFFVQEHTGTSDTEIHPVVWFLFWRKSNNKRFLQMTNIRARVLVRDF